MTVQGEAGIPIVELYDSPDEGLIFSIASAASSTQQGQPTSEAPFTIIGSMSWEF